MKPQDKADPQAAAEPQDDAKQTRLICLCNEISQSEVEAAISRGCKTLSRIFDATTAGVGACGGSCQPTLRKMLEEYQATGTFPENPRPPSAKTRDRKTRDQRLKGRPK